MRRLLVVLLALWSCSGGGPSTFQCPAGTVPCGNGCKPVDGVCCEDQSSSATSSYCTNGAGGGCYANNGRNCQAGFPANTTARFCCAANGTFGSNDCPAGQHHCGLTCKPIDSPCCPSNASTADCPTETAVSPVAVDCGCCRATGLCYHCGAGRCCGAGDLCQSAGGCPAGGGVCVGVASSGGGGGGGGVCAYWSCGGSSQCASVMGAPSGVQCTFAAGQTCQGWCHTYVPGNCTCR